MAYNLLMLRLIYSVEEHRGTPLWEDKAAEYQKFLTLGQDGKKSISGGLSRNLAFLPSGIWRA
jgi:hypothetical protein